MRLRVAKNGKQYRCDYCHKLLRSEDVCSWRDPGGIARHFCSLPHKGKYITERYNLPLFLETGEQMTGHVIPVKNGASNK